jgi:acetyl esterase/lipase
MRNAVRTQSSSRYAFRYSRLRAAFVAGCLLVAGCHFADAQENRPRSTPPAGVLYEPDLVYGTGAGQPLQLDLARPESAGGPLPCVVFIHGGAWRGGNRQSHTDLVFQLAQQGYVAATVQYRLCPQHVFPAQVEDVKCAIRFLRAHADKYQLDPQRIGVVGFSAGAHLAMMLGVLGPEDGMEGEGGWAEFPSQVAAVVSFVGPTDLAADDLPDVSIPLVRDFIGGSVADRREAYAAASPLTHVTEGDAAMLLFQGTKDHLIPTTQAVKMAEKMTENGVAGRVELLIGAGHGWGNPEQDRTMQAMLHFLRQHLRPADR